MTAPFAYTHPRNISSGYRTTSRNHEDDYSSKSYPADEDEYYRHPPYSSRDPEEYSCSRYTSGGSDYSHKPTNYSTTYDEHPKHSSYSRADDVYHKSQGKSDDYYHSKREDEYPMYHRDHCKMTRGANCCTCVDELQDVKVQSRRPQEGYTRISSDTHTTAKDYHEGIEETDAGGQFYPQQVVVVTSQRGGTTAKTLSREQPPPPRHLATSGGCCQSAVALVLITLLVIAFLLISGFLFYFNIVTYAPESSSEDLCEDVHCAHGGICMVDPEGQPVCRCPVDCPEVLVPVCGTDGQTYDNMCALRLHSCTNKRTILVQHTGPCDTGDPCQEKQCVAGATCEVSEDGLSASCVCPQHCPVYSNHLAMSPLCGTDNRDYTDQCQMYRHACEHSVTVSVKYEGPCDPCASKECPVPEVCQLDEDRQPECRCAEVCAEDMNPVCGSDGYTYINECFMRLQACWTKTSLRVIFTGPCSSGINPCKGVVCSDGEECTISKFGISQCECVSQCEPVVRQVCGSDSKTYDSKCHLRKASCLERSGVTFLYNGACDAELSCKDMVCEFEAECVMKGGEPSCECPRCAPHYEPLCGSDGRNYNSPCELRASNCHHKRNIESVHQGVCNGCETKTCSYFATCETDKEGIAKCVCKDKCPEDEKPAPVCGSNGVTYKSECELRKFVCEKKELVEVDYEGDCESCLEVVCKYGARCRAGVCVCPTDCPQHLDEPVCASNLDTYDNECDMQKQACAFNPPALLTVIFFGACSIKFKINRSNQTITPTTVTTAMTPRNPCLDIQCDFGASCELGEDGFPRCSCLFDCSQEDLTLICGSDFHIYNSSCAMKMEACQRQKEIRLRPLDLCKGMEVKPCNGEGAVLDPETGEELDCGSGPKRKDCPLDSYCHQTPHFARCCPKESGVYLKSCQDSWYGCCPDKKTPAQGPEHLGCPSLCGCNKIGSYSEACVGDSDQCQCKPGVGGLKCDRCEPGYWGLPKITSGYQGCLACGCSLLGSVREDCEQMTGRCVCKPGVQGHKCDTCVDPLHTLTTKGCTSEVESTPSSLCEVMACGFGADCVETPDGPQCVCSLSCPESELEEMICGDDGKLYASRCQLELFVCQVQKQIGLQDMSYCSGVEDKAV